MSTGDVFALLCVIGGFIAIAGILAGVYMRRLEFQERKLEIMARQAAEKAAQYAAHNAKLEDRVRVLERIVTDEGGHDVARQIEALRDAQPTGMTAQ